MDRMTKVIKICCAGEHTSPPYGRAKAVWGKATPSCKMLGKDGMLILEFSRKDFLELKIRPALRAINAITKKIQGLLPQHKLLV